VFIGGVAFTNALVAVHYDGQGMGSVTDPAGASVDLLGADLPDACKYGSKAACRAPTWRSLRGGRFLTGETATYMVTSPASTFTPSSRLRLTATGRGLGAVLSDRREHFHQRVLVGGGALT